MGARVHGPIEQATFLRNLGVEKRATALKAYAQKEKADEIDAAVKRLIAEGSTEMGKLFKVIGVANPALGKLPGFE
jgi:SAM-dependent MidA family methyltransferase